MIRDVTLDTYFKCHSENGFLFRFQMRIDMYSKGTADSVVILFRGKEKTFGERKIKKGDPHFNQSMFYRVDTCDSKCYNSKFDNSDGHHIDESHVIYLPKKLHRSIPHNLRTWENMGAINAVAFSFLFQEHK